MCFTMLARSEDSWILFSVYISNFSRWLMSDFVALDSKSDCFELADRLCALTQSSLFSLFFDQHQLLNSLVLSELFVNPEFEFLSFPQAFFPLVWNWATISCQFLIMSFLYWISILLFQLWKIQISKFSIMAHFHPVMAISVPLVKGKSIICKTVRPLPLTAENLFALIFRLL